MLFLFTQNLFAHCLALLMASAPAKATAHVADHSVMIFIAEIALMLLVGRLLGEVMQRIGQPAVMGQLIAGVALGPSVLGAIWPEASHAIFPDTIAQKKMIDGISQLGVLMLLLITGMETDLALVKRMRRTAFSTSIGGILLPFVCGFLIGEFLPDAMIPDPRQRLATSLFLATALSISSVKIVAMVVMEADFTRRNVGQIILASAILDDTVGWIIIALIGAIVAEGSVNVASLSFSVLGTAIFLVFSFTVGGRLVAHVIRWTNDHLSIEMPVITAILVLTFAGALLTDYIGVHTVLGAFVVGILVGQSPILTKHIEEQLRGLVVALFAPIFFAVAGLSVDLTVLKSPYLLKLAIALILIASFGKIVGCYVGGRFGRMTHREATALAIGMNARGSTEVIVATIGLSMGVLTRDIFTLIVFMAITTTLITPPLLRWALARIPPTGEEKERLEREQAEAKDSLPKIERLLITVDNSPDGRLASMLGGLFAGTRQIMASVLELGAKETTTLRLTRDNSSDVVKMSMDAAAQKLRGSNGEEAVTAVLPDVLTRQITDAELSEAILGATKKGFEMLFLGVERALEIGDKELHTFNSSVGNIWQDFKGATAIAIARGDHAEKRFDHSLNILVPTTGTDYSRRGAEVAIAIAKASGSRVTALHVSSAPSEALLIRQIRKLLNTGRAIVTDVRDLGTREGVRVTPIVKVRRAPEAAILRQIKRGKHNLVVLGVKARTGEKLSFGPRVTVLLENTPCSLLIVTS